MTHVPGNRGIQPPYNVLVSSFPRRAGRVESNQSGGQKAQPVRFAGSQAHNAITNAGQRFVNFSLPSFEKITEVFIWGFLAQDVIAMWLPRIYALLTEGRKAYDPKDDPGAKNQPFGKQFKKYIKGNLEGLNWENFYEGTKREFATGPGLLIVPAALFLAASKVANTAIKMPYASVKGIGEGLRASLGNKNAQEVGAEGYQKAVGSYVEKMFQDPVFKEKKGPELKIWSQKWVKNLYHTDAKEKKATMETLGKDLQEMVRNFNREHRMVAYQSKENPLVKDEHPLHRSDSTWVSYEPKAMEARLEKGQLDKAGKHLRQMPVTDLLRDLTQMEGMVKSIEQKGADARPLSEAARHTMEDLVKKKFGMAVGATVITAAYLTKLAFWAQNHNTYQATRFLNEKTAQNQGSNNHQPAKAQSQCTSPASPFASVAGSTHGLQPAFSQAGQPFTLPVQPPKGNPMAWPKPNQSADPFAAERRNA